MEAIFGVLGNTASEVDSPESVRMKVAIIATAVCGCWWTAEFIRSSLQRKLLSRQQDKGSSQIWDVAHLLGVIGVFVGFTEAGHVRRGQHVIATIGVLLMGAGLFIRLLALYTLGKYFTGRVTIFENHRLVRTGPYQHVRHPGYARALVAYLGFGLAFSNWISLLLIFCPVLAAALYRMQIEEHVLRDAFGQEYLDYMKETKRILPGIY